MSWNKQRPIVKLAHRGAMLTHPENTLRAFKASIDAGFDGVELDVRACKTGELVVFHDADLERLAGRPERIHDLALDEIQSVKIQGEPIPLLKDVLKKLPNDCIIAIELKESLADEVLAAVKTAKQTLIIGSKDRQTVKQLSTAKTAHSIVFITAWHVILTMSMLQQLGADTVFLHHRIASWFNIRSAKRSGVAVYCYPVRNRLIEGILKSHAVDGLLYDRKLS